MGYLTNFIVYTFAMVGVIMFAVFIFKTSTSTSKRKTGNNLKVIDTLSLGPRKTLYVISTGEEKFLIAGDVDRTSLISKLDEKRDIKIVKEEIQDFKQILEEPSKKVSYMDRSSLGIYSTKNKPYNSVMKNLSERLKQK